MKLALKRGRVFLKSSKASPSLSILMVSASTTSSSERNCQISAHSILLGGAVLPEDCQRSLVREKALHVCDQATSRFDTIWSLRGPNLLPDMASSGEVPFRDPAWQCLPHSCIVAQYALQTRNALSNSRECTFLAKNGHHPVRAHSTCV